MPIPEGSISVRQGGKWLKSCQRHYQHGPGFQKRNHLSLWNIMILENDKALKGVSSLVVWEKLKFIFFCVLIKFAVGSRSHLSSKQPHSMKLRGEEQINSENHILLEKNEGANYWQPAGGDLGVWWKSARWVECARWNRLCQQSSKRAMVQKRPVLEWNKWQKASFIAKARKQSKQFPEMCMLEVEQARRIKSSCKAK